MASGLDRHSLLNSLQKAIVPEISFVVKKGGLGKIADACIRTHGVSVASRVLDDIKNQGYKYSTVSGTTVAVIDALIPEKKKEFLAEAEAKVEDRKSTR